MQISFISKLPLLIYLMDWLLLNVYHIWEVGGAGLSLSFEAGETY